MDSKQMDRIIVKSNERMKKVLSWYVQNKEWLDKEEFHMPMDCGVIELQEENLDIVFERTKNDLVQISIIPTIKPNIPPSVIFDYDPVTTKASNYRFAPGLPKAKRELLKNVILYDKTDMKEALKYHALMLFMNHYQEIVEVTESAPRPRKEAKKMCQNRKGLLPLIRKVYVLKDADDVKKKHEKRAYTCPDHEVTVRGFWRTYKSGKKVWVKSFVRFKGKGQQQKKRYIV